MSIIEGSKLVDQIYSRINFVPDEITNKFLDKEKDPLRYNPIDPRKVTGKKEKHRDKHSGCHQQHSPVVSRTIQTEFHIQGTLRGRSPSRVPVKGGGKGQSFFKSLEKVSEIQAEKNKSPKEKHSPSKDKSVDDSDDEMSEKQRKLLLLSRVLAPAKKSRHPSSVYDEEERKLIIIDSADMDCNNNSIDDDIGVNLVSLSLVSPTPSPISGPTRKRRRLSSDTSSTGKLLNDSLTSTITSSTPRQDSVLRYEEDLELKEEVSYDSDEYNNELDTDLNSSAINGEETSDLGSSLSSSLPSFSNLEQSQVCMYCGNVYESHKQLMAHVKRYHDDTALKCDICFKECRNKKSLQYHLRTHKQVKCTGC